MASQNMHIGSVNTTGRRSKQASPGFYMLLFYIFFTCCYKIHCGYVKNAL